MRSRRRWTAAGLAVGLAVALLRQASAAVDIPAQLYAMKQRGEDVSSILGYMPDELPTVLTDRLNGADFASLSSALQRALLWDVGLLFVGNYSSLVQVQTVCGETMSSIFLANDTVKSVAECDLVVCNAQIVNFAYPNCSVSLVEEITQCAIEENDALSSITDNPVWSEDGELELSSTYRVYRFEASSSSSSSVSSGSSSSDTTVLYTINEKPELSMVDPASCPNKATFVVPCRVLASSSSQSDSVSVNAWCKPESGVLVDLWLEEEVAAMGEAKSSDRWMRIALSFICLFGILLVSGIGYFFWKKHNTSATTSNPASSEPPDTVQYAFLGPELPTNARVRLQKATSETLSPSSSTSGDVQRANAEMCRRSPQLRAFCDDKDLMLKKISYRSLRLDKLIAKGANGEVRRGEYAHQTVAIKRLLLEMRDDIRCIEYFAKEIHIASILEHPNIVRFIGVSWRLLSELCMVSEFLPQGDLAHYLASPASQSLTWKTEKISLASDIASALVYLHSLVPVIIHRDLKSLNVLLTDSLEAKLSDFGLSRERTFEETMTSGVGTLLWTAPEILRGDRYSEKADIYSYGVVLSELDTCLPPYKLNEELVRGKTKSFELLPMIRNGRISPRFSPTVPPALFSLAQLCLDQNPERRPNAMQIVYILQSKVLPTL